MRLNYLCLFLMRQIRFTLDRARDYEDIREQERALLLLSCAIACHIVRALEPRPLEIDEDDIYKALGFSDPATPMTVIKSQLLKVIDASRGLSEWPKPYAPKKTPGLPGRRRTKIRTPT